MNERASEAAKKRVSFLKSNMFYVIDPYGRVIINGLDVVNRIMKGEQCRVYRAENGQITGMILLNTAAVAHMESRGKAMVFLSAALQIRRAESMLNVLRCMGFIV